MGFRRFISSFFAIIMLLSCAPKPIAKIYSASDFYGVIIGKLVCETECEEVPEWVQGDSRRKILQMLYVMPSYWQVCSIHEMLMRFSFPYIPSIGAVGYLVELMKGNISPEEKVMLENSLDLDEIQVNLHNMIIAYGFFIGSIKNNLPKECRVWVKENCRQLWKLGIEVEATAEPICKVCGGEKCSKTTYMLCDDNPRDVLGDGKSVNGVVSKIESSDTTIVDGIQVFDWNCLQPVTRNIKQENVPKIHKRKAYGGASKSVDK